MTATLVQSASNSTAGAATVTVGSTQGWATPTAGNLLVAWADSDATVTVNNSMSAGPSVVDNNAAYFWYKIATGAETSWTFTPGGTTSPTAVGVLEYSGVATSPFDGQNFSSIPALSGTTTTAASITTTGTVGDLVVALAGLHASTAAAFPTSPTWTNSFVNRQAVNAGVAASGINCTAFVADFQSTAAGTVSTSCSWTNTAGDRQELIIAFKLSAGGPAPPAATFVAASSGQSTATSGSVATSYPAGVATGDRIFLEFSSIATFTTPSGWTEIRRSTNGTVARTTVIAYWDYDGTAAPSIAVTGKSAWTMAAFRKSDPGNTWTIRADLDATDTTTGTTITPPSATAQAGDTSILFTTGRGTATGSTAITTTAPANWTEPTGGDVSTAAGTTTALRQIFASQSYQLNLAAGSSTPGAVTFSASSAASGTQVILGQVPVVPTVGADLTGSGTLTATQSAAAAQAAALTGSGTLTATQSAATTQAAALTGSGTLATTQSAAATGSADFTGSGALTATATPGIASFVEDFSTQDTTRWSGWGADVSASGGVLTFNVTSAYPQIVAIGTAYSLRESSIYVQNVSWPDAGGGSRQEFFRVVPTNPDVVGNQSLYWWNQGDHVGYGQNISGVLTETEITATMATAYSWWRIRESAGTVYFDTSPDGITWTQRGTRTTPAWTTSAGVLIQAGYYGTESASTLVLDNINIPGPRTVSADLTGSGALTATQSAAAAQDAALTGSGTLTASTAPALTTSAGYSGSGTLTASQLAGQTAAAALSGAGTLSTTQAPNPGTAAALSGSGTLSVTQTAMAATAAAAFTGSGTLATTQTPAVNQAAALSGSGSLTSSQAPAWTKSATLSGSGTLSATSTAPAITTAAALSGSGALATTQTPAVGQAAALSGSGTLATTQAPAVSRSAALSGSGTLATTQTLAAAASAGLTGSGTLAAGQIPAVARAADLSGSGTLAATTAGAGQVDAALTGSGMLAATQAPAVTQGAALSGNGALTATQTPAPATTANLSGAGTLAATTAPAITAAAALSSSGALATTQTPAATQAAALSGSGTLAATTSPHGTTTAALNGEGSLAALAAYRMYGTASPPAAAATDTGPLVLGVEFYVTASAHLIEICWWQPSTNSPSTASRSAALYLVSDQSQILATAAVAPIGSGWQKITLDTPYDLAPNTRYVAAVLHPGGQYPATAFYYGGATDEVNGPLVVPVASDTVSGNQNSFIYQATLSYPTQSFDSSNYWTDVTVVPFGQAAAADFAGSGTLTATATAAGNVNAALTGSGALTTSQAPAVTQGAALSGNGALTATQVPAPVTAAGLSGSGTLAATTAVAVTTPADLSGSGTLTVTTAGQGTVDAALTGSGTLTTSQAPAVTRAVSLNGTGTLAVAANPQITAIGALSGTGSLAATATTGHTATADLSGAGTLTATTSGAGAATAALSGSGTLTATITAVTATTSAPLSGTGTLTATTIPATTTAADLSGAGTLAASAGSGVIRAADLSGSGTLAASSTPRVVATVAATGSGTLSATVTTARTAAAPLAGLGTLAAVTVPALEAAAQAQGLGTLTAVVHIGRVVNANLTGAGTFAVTGLFQHGVPVDITYTTSTLTRSWDGTAIPRGVTAVAVPRSWRATGLQLQAAT